MKSLKAWILPLLIFSPLSARSAEAPKPEPILNASPYNSTIAFLGRSGNLKNILDWSDLVQEGLELLVPKTSGAARWTYLAAGAFASNKFAAEDAKALNFIRDLYARVLSNGS